MRKLLILIMLLCLPVYAEQAVTTRVQKEVSDACYNVPQVGTKVLDYFICVSNAYSNSYYWRNGWSQQIKGNVTSLFSKPFTGPLTYQEEDAYKGAFQTTYVQYFNTIIGEVRRTGDPNLKFDAATVAKFK